MKVEYGIDLDFLIRLLAKKINLLLFSDLNILKPSYQ